MFDASEVLKLFPAKEFRKHQKETLLKVVDHFNSGGRCVIIKAPTGSGKSPLNCTLGAASGSAFYTTPQLTLIDQLVNDRLTGPMVREVKGRSNYVCKIDADLRCDLGLCETKNYKCIDKEEICPYAIAKNRALKSPVALMSFTYFVLEGRNDNSSFGNRRMLIVDEAHNIGEDIVEHESLTLSIRNLPKDVFKVFEYQIRSVKCFEAAKTIVKNVSIACSKKLSQLRKNEKLTKEQQGEYRHLKKFMASAESFIMSADDTDWIFQVDTDYYGDCSFPKLVLRPLYARYFSGMLWKRAERYVLSSATFMPNFIREVGLDRLLREDEIAWIDVPSTFPAENRPIINRTCGYMTYQHKAVTLPKAVKALEEGQNWADDICKAQVLFKVPFPHIGDKRVAVRLNEKHDWGWYNGLALLMVEQAYGRAVRSLSDSARFYVVDSSFPGLLRKCKGSVDSAFAEGLPAEWRLNGNIAKKQLLLPGLACGGVA